MNVYKPSKKIGTWPQMVVRLTKERDELVAENRKLEEENMELKRRCCDLWRQVMEAQAKNDS
jgi:regulator of replication initiation timing